MDDTPALIAKRIHEEAKKVGLYIPKGLHNDHIGLSKFWLAFVNADNEYRERRASVSSTSTQRSVY